MRIQEIEITDILGTEHMLFRPGTLTIIQGENASGKSSLLGAMMTIFTGGHDPDLIRRGAQRGVVRWLLDNGVTVEKTITTKRSTLEIRDAEGTQIPAPQTFIESLGRSWAVDPGELCRIDAKSKTGMKLLVERILGTLGISFTPQELAAEIGVAAPRNWSIEELEVHRAEVYEIRAAANRRGRDAEGAVARLRAALPSETQVVDSSRREEIRQRCEGGQRTADAALNALAEREHAELIALKQRFQIERDAIIQARDSARQALMEEDRRLEEAAQARARAEGVRQQLAIEEQRTREQFVESERCTRLIEKLDALKRSKLGALPIEGLTYEDGKLLIDGVPWPQVNTARRLDIASQISAAAKGDLPLLILEDAEKFDAGNWEGVREWAHQSGYQVIAARVKSSGPLEIMVDKEN